MTGRVKQPTSMARVGLRYRCSDSDVQAENYGELNAWMDVAHFKAERQAIILDEDAELFDGQIMAGCIPIIFHEASGEVHTFTQRLLQQISQDRVDAYLITIPQRGTFTIRQNQRATFLEPGYFGISYTNLPLTITSGPSAELDHLSYHILAPGHMVAERLHDPRRLCGMSFPLKDGSTWIARDLIISIYEQVDSLDHRTAEAFAHAALDALLGAAERVYQAQVKVEPGRRETNLRMVLDYMEFHCFDPDLCPRKVAQGCGISVRYLHQLLKDANFRFGDHLWKRRLRSAHRQLAERHLSRKSVAEIAYTVGFKNSAHFSRAFRKEFGMTPRSVRAGTVSS